MGGQNLQSWALYGMCCFISWYRFSNGLKERALSIVNDCRLLRNASKYVTVPVSYSGRLILIVFAVRSSVTEGVRCFR